MNCSTGKYYTVVLSDDGTLHSFGWNEFGQLGLGHIKKVSGIEQITNLDQKIKMISCGFDFTVCVDEKGFMWLFGMNESVSIHFKIPQKIKNISNVQSISCGYSHILILTNDRNLWSWGNNEYGQLCLGNTEEPSISGPKRTSYTNVSNIYAGSNHSLFQNDEGIIFACGFNKNGELGLGHNKFSQTKVSIIPNQPPQIIKICCGMNHSLFLDGKGNVYSVGKNDKGQLGIGDNINKNLLQQISNIPKIKTISVGDFSGYLLDYDGKIWSFGANEKCQLGHGDTENRNLPKKIISLKNIQQISSGFGEHFLAKDSHNKIYIMGSNKYEQLGCEKPEFIQFPKIMHSKYDTIWASNSVERNILNVESTSCNISSSFRTEEIKKKEVEILKYTLRGNENIQELIENNRILIGLVENLRKQKIERENKHYENIEKIWKNICIKFSCAQRPVKPSDFKNIQYLGRGCHGLVMKCDLPYHFNGQLENITVALKMIINLYPDNTKAHVTRAKNEFDILLYNCILTLFICWVNLFVNQQMIC